MISMDEGRALGNYGEQFIETYGKSLIFKPDDKRIPLTFRRFDPSEGYFTDWPEEVTENEPLEMLDIPRKTDEIIHVEGGDIFATYMNPETHDFKYSWIEVKSVGNGSILHFGRDGFPTVPFEIISNRETKTKGWLWHLLHPSESNELRKFSHDQLRTKAPSALVYCCYDGKIGESNVFAMISFYDCPKLFEALKVIAMDRYNLDLSAWRCPGMTQDQKAKWHRDCPANYWNVSLNLLQQLGVPMAITLLGGEPRLNEADEFYRLNYNRWCRLKEMATAHYNLEDLKKDFTGIPVPDEEPDWEHLD